MNVKGKITYEGVERIDNGWWEMELSKFRLLPDNRVAIHMRPPWDLGPYDIVLTKEQAEQLIRELKKQIARGGS